jgi:hypothetical protein
MSSLRYRIAFVLMCSAPLGAQAPAPAPPPSPEVQQARVAGDSAIAHRDWGALVAVYKPLTRSAPTQGMPWLRAGVGYAQMGNLSEATTALRKAIDLQFQVPSAEYWLARVYARRGMRDSAIAMIGRATAGGLPVEMITHEPDLAPVRGAPAYTTLIDSLEKQRYPCRSMPEAHQLDFWIGDWTVTPWAAGPSVSIGPRSENHISPILEHCVIEENWVAASGAKGRSMNFFDPNRRLWRQIWMDESMWSLDYEGSYSDGAMRFHGWSRGPNGQTRLEKLTFFNISPDTVRQLFEQSTDSGKTWATTFDGRYVRIKH